jgi:hypothetical protein
MTHPIHHCSFTYAMHHRMVAHRATGHRAGALRRSGLHSVRRQTSEGADVCNRCITRLASVATIDMIHALGLLNNNNNNALVTVKYALHMVLLLDGSP